MSSLPSRTVTAAVTCASSPFPRASKRKPNPGQVVVDANPTRSSASSASKAADQESNEHDAKRSKTQSSLSTASVLSYVDDGSEWLIEALIRRHYDEATLRDPKCTRVHLVQMLLEAIECHDEDWGILYEDRPPLNPAEYGSERLALISVSAKYHHGELHARTHAARKRMSELYDKSVEATCKFDKEHGIEHPFVVPGVPESFEKWCKDDYETRLEMRAAARMKNQCTCGCRAHGETDK